MNAKSQLTLFVLIGIVVLILFGLLYYLHQYVKGQDFSDEKGDLEALFQKQGKYHGYVSSCLEQSAKQALILVGMQGGALYSYQANGTKPYLGPPAYPYGQYILPFVYADVFDLYSSDKVIFNVSYVIYKPDLTRASSAHPALPEYPYGEVPLISNPSVLGYAHPFGNAFSEPLAPLCDYYGKNSPTLEGALYTCESYDSKRKDDHQSIQEYLEAYIAEHTVSCVDFSVMPELANATVTKGNVSAHVVFTQEQVYVSLDFPILLQKGSYATEVKVENLETQLDVRFKKIYELLDHLIERDVTDVFFDIARDAQTVKECRDLISGALTPCLKEGMKVYKYRDVCSSSLCKNHCDGCFDDLLVIEDSRSLIDGKPYLFFGVIENRIPALDLLRQKDTIAQAFIGYDYVVSVGSELALDPKGYDPDEDDMLAYSFMRSLYRYGGWNEDYVETVDTSYASYEAFWEHPEWYTTRTYSSPQLFTLSSFYQATHRNASLIIADSDLGPHITTVQICDNEGLCDYQNVHVVVASTPELAGYHMYSGIPQNYLSLEDPYYFTDLSDEVSQELASSYLWESDGFSITSGTPLLEVPREEYTIESLPSFMRSYFSLGTHLVSLSAFDDMGAPLSAVPEGWTVEVKDCFPYRSAVPPYPFNGETDPFFADHTCCMDDYTYAPSGTECYRETLYGCKYDITHAAADLSDTAVYTAEQTGVCSGNRGNMCADSGSSAPSKLKDCSECMGCANGNSDCVPLARGNACGAGPACSGETLCQTFICDGSGGCAPDPASCVCSPACGGTCP